MYLHLQVENILSVTPLCTLLEESIERIENSGNNVCIKTIRNYFNPLCTVCQLEPNAQYSKNTVELVKQILSQSETSNYSNYLVKNQDSNRIYQRIRIPISNIYFLSIYGLKKISGKIKSCLFLAALSGNLFF